MMYQNSGLKTKHSARFNYMNTLQSKQTKKSTLNVNALEYYPRPNVEHQKCDGSIKTKEFNYNNNCKKLQYIRSREGSTETISTPNSMRTRSPTPDQFLIDNNNLDFAFNDFEPASTNNENDNNKYFYIDRSYTKIKNFNSILNYIEENFTDLQISCDTQSPKYLPCESLNTTIKNQAEIKYIKYKMSKLQQQITEGKQVRRTFPRSQFNANNSNKHENEAFKRKIQSNYHK